jgi:hypothetical protein
MSFRAYFSTDAYRDTLFELAMLFKTRIISFDDADQLQTIIGSMATEPSFWDQHCQVTAQKYGDVFRTSLLNIITSQTQEHFDVLRAFALVFVLELDLSTSEPISESLQIFKESTSAIFGNRSDRAGAIVKFGREQLPIAILKKILNSSEVGHIKNIDTAVKEADQKISKWDNALNEHKIQVTALKKALEEQQHGFNFVGLYQGFSDMAATVTRELDKKKERLVLFGALIFSPAVVDVALIITKNISIDTLSLQAMLSLGAISLTCTAIFLYFFRILLRDIDSKDAQLVQLRLRMSLCQFVQNYAKFASDIQKDNPETLARFESVIFSGIVGTQDKLPSTFDGLEQIATLVKNVRGN